MVSNQVSPCATVCESRSESRRSAFTGGSEAACVLFWPVGPTGGYLIEVAGYDDQHGTVSTHHCHTNSTGAL